MKPSAGRTILIASILGIAIAAGSYVVIASRAKTESVREASPISDQQIDRIVQLTHSEEETFRAIWRVMRIRIEIDIRNNDELSALFAQNPEAKSKLLNETRAALKNFVSFSYKEIFPQLRAIARDGVRSSDYDQVQAFLTSPAVQKINTAAYGGEFGDVVEEVAAESEFRGNSDRDRFKLAADNALVKDLSADESAVVAAFDRSDYGRRYMAAKSAMGEKILKHVNKSHPKYSKVEQVLNATLQDILSK